MSVAYRGYIKRTESINFPGYLLICFAIINCSNSRAMDYNIWILFFTQCIKCPYIRNIHFWYICRKYFHILPHIAKGPS